MGGKLIQIIKEQEKSVGDAMVKVPGPYLLASSSPDVSLFLILSHPALLLCDYASVLQDRVVNPLPNPLPGGPVDYFCSLIFNLSSM